MLISSLFMIPDALLLCLFLFSINFNIRFAQWEQHGIEYQRPLEDLLENPPKHLQRTGQSSSNRTNPGNDITTIQRRIDADFLRLEAVDAELGISLQFTDEGLAKRKRGHFRAQTLKAEWQNLKSHLATLAPAERVDQHRHLTADVST